MELAEPREASEDADGKAQQVMVENSTKGLEAAVLGAA